MFERVICVSNNMSKRNFIHSTSYCSLKVKHSQSLTLDTKNSLFGLVKVKTKIDVHLHIIRKKDFFWALRSLRCLQESLSRTLSWPTQGEEQIFKTFQNRRSRASKKPEKTSSTTRGKDTHHSIINLVRTACGGVRRHLCPLHRLVCLVLSHC